MAPPEPESPLTDPHSLVGRRVSHYEVLELLGAGGMGVLYKAADTRLGRPVALKFLPPQLSLDSAFKERFEREARAVAALDHPNVCTIHEIGETEDGQLFIAMAYYQGETVKQKIARGPLEVEEALELAKQAASGLVAAHRTGLVHRDIRPANLMATEEGVLKILDFGLAKTGETALTELGTLLGTPAYLSPEQTRGEEADARADLWSLGVVLYEMLTGDRPFLGGGDSAVIDAIRREDPRPPGELREGVPEEVEGLVLRLLSKDPEARYAGADLLSEELAASARSLGSVWSRLPARSKMAGVLLLVAGGAILLSIRPPPTPASPDLVAVLPWAVQGESSDLDYLEEGLVDLLSISLADLPGIRAVDPYALVKFVERSCGDAADPECGAAAAQQFGAGRFLIGTIVPAGGETFQLAASIYEADGTQMNRTTVLADAREPLVAIEEMGRRIAAELLGSDESEVDAASKLPAVAARTTSSLPALKAYLEGEALFRSGQYEEAIAALRDAVAADSSFALAWYRIAVTATSSLNYQLADSAAERALEGMDRLPSRYRRLLQGFDYFRVGKADLAEREFRNLLAIYPNDPEAWFLLAETQQSYNILKGLPRGGEEAYARALELDPDLAPALWQLRLAAFFDGRLDEFDSLTRRYIEQFPEAEGMTPVRLAKADLRLVTLLKAEDDSTRERWFAELEEASDDEVNITAGVLQDISWPDHVEDAVRAARILIDPARSASARVGGHSILAVLAFREGRWREANRELDAFATIDPVEVVMRRSQWAAVAPFLPMPAGELSAIRGEAASIIEGSARKRTLQLPWGFEQPPAEIVASILIRLSVLSTRLGEYEKARGYASQFAAVPKLEPWASSTIPDDFQLILRAYIHNGQGDPQAARAALDSTRFEAHWGVAALPHVFWSMFLRAEVHYQLGELEEARRWYSLWPANAFNIGAMHELGPALYRLGQIHEAMGELAEARERFEQFVQLWANADPAFQPWVEDARDRIAALGDTLPG
jgi:tetratricopeptide (TPR) repeat protein